MRLPEMPLGAMKKFPALFLVFFSIAVLAQVPPPLPGPQPTGPLPDKPSPQSTPLSKPADYSQEPYVVQDFRSQIVFENDGTGKKTYGAAIKVQSDLGVQQWGQLVFGYNS